jgi:hypothetical protein
MKTKLFLQALILTILTLTIGRTEAQTVIWERKALGQQRSFPCAGGTFNWPNNNAWTQDQRFDIDTVCDPDQQYEAEPSNWSTPTFPNGASVDVILGNTGGAPTNLDRGAPIAVHSVTILNVGGLTAEYGSSLTANLLDLQGDGSVPAAGGGGPNPIFTLAGGGTLKKSSGSGTYAFTLGVILQVPNGGTIASQAGTLQLPGFASAYAGGVNFNAASGAVIDLAPAEAVGAGTVQITGLFTGNNVGGTVRLKDGYLTTVPGSGGATFNFPGSTFQWQSGAIGSSAADPFINIGTMNITGTPALNGQGFINQGTVVQSGSGALNVGYGRGLTNAASGTLDLQNDNGFTVIGGGGGNPFFDNFGTVRKSAGTGTSIFGAGLSVTNRGTIEALTGTLQFWMFTQESGTTALNGGNLNFLNDAVFNGGSLVGNGTITGNVRNNGATFGPGFSPGKITINGNYIQGANGVMTLEIGGAAAGTEYDQLQVSGAVALGGTLNISLINGFRPAVGDVFPIILPGSFTGAFSSINTTGFTGQVNYSAGAISITILTVSGTPTPTPTATPSKLLNISTRLRVQTGDNALIGGLIITGTDPKRVIIRGIGTSLSSFFSGALPDPTLELYQGSTLLAMNDNWKTDQQAEVEATGIPPTNDFESAIVRTLTPGSYTTVLRGKNNTTGIGVVEAYDLNLTANSRLANISTRGFVETGDNVMIGGLIIGPAGGANAKLVVRAIGPSLGNFGIAGALQDPTLTLVNSNGVAIISNDNWRESQETEIIATGLAPSDDHESAIVQTVAPGSYTAIVRGVGALTGVALVEAYHLQ